MHAEQTPKGIISVVIKAIEKKDCCTPGEPLKKDARNDSLRLHFEEYLEKEISFSR